MGVLPAHGGLDCQMEAVETDVGRHLQRTLDGGLDVFKRDLQFDDAHDLLLLHRDPCNSMAAGRRDRVVCTRPRTRGTQDRSGQRDEACPYARRYCARIAACRTIRCRGCPSLGLDLSMKKHVRAAFAMEADASVTSLVVAAGLREQGRAAMWNASANWPMQADLAARFDTILNKTADVVRAASAAIQLGDTCGRATSVTKVIKNLTTPVRFAAINSL